MANLSITFFCILASSNHFKNIKTISHEKNYYPIVTIFALLLILFSASRPALANSPNPTIINGNVILCPGGQETLITQEYDTYQWYKNGNLIPGATQQTHVITFYQDVGSNFSVFVTLGTQSAMSLSIFVDGYMFLPLVVSSYGQGYWFTAMAGKCANTMNCFSSL